MWKRDEASPQKERALGRGPRAGGDRPVPPWERGDHKRARRRDCRTRAGNAGRAGAGVAPAVQIGAPGAQPCPRPHAEDPPLHARCRGAGDSARHGPRRPARHRRSDRRPGLSAEGPVRRAARDAARVLCRLGQARQARQPPARRGGRAGARHGQGHAHRRRHLRL